MNRRDFNLLMAAFDAGLLINGSHAEGRPPASSDGPVFAMLVHPKMILLDLLGPMTIFNMTRGTVHLVWKDTMPVATDVGNPGDEGLAIWWLFAARIRCAFRFYGPDLSPRDGNVAPDGSAATILAHAPRGAVYGITIELGAGAAAAH